MLNKISKYSYAIVFLISLIFTLSSNTNTVYSAATCGTNECGAGTYVCQNGTYCCTGGGCPSWECANSSYTPKIKNGEWKCCYTGLQGQDVCDAAAVLSGGTCAPCAGTDLGTNKGTGTGCRVSAMGSKFNITFPPNGGSYDGATSVRLRWSDVIWSGKIRGNWITRVQWGHKRVSCAYNNYYDVYIRRGSSGSFNRVGRFPGGKNTSVKTTVVSHLIPGSRYYWKVKAVNAALADGVRWSSTWYFDIPVVIPPTVTVQGTIWNATDSSCSISSGSRDSKEIPRSALDGSITVIADSISGNWNPNGGAQSYAVSDVTKGDSKTVCANLPAPADLPNFKYSLECVNGSTSGRLSASCATVDIQNSPTTIDLGFKLSSHGWFQVNNADIFANCSSCIDSISLGIPSASDVLGGFEDALIAGKGIVFGNSDLSVKNPSGDTKLTSDDNDHWAKGLEDANFVPPSFLSVAQNFDEDTFTNVSGGDCNNLLTGGAKVNNVYSMTRNCAQDAIDNISAGTDYNLSTDAEGDNTGVTFLFVAKNSGSSDPLVFTEEFKSNSSNKRVVFIVQDSIEIDSSLGIVTPTTSSSPSIEAGLISVESINFPSAESDEGDSTVIVEGPIVALTGSISFERDRLENNGYPATVVIYNPFYLTGISSNVKALVGLIDITWILEN